MLLLCIRIYYWAIEITLLNYDWLFRALGAFCVGANVRAKFCCYFLCYLFFVPFRQFLIQYLRLNIVLCVTFDSLYSYGRPILERWRCFYVWSTKQNYIFYKIWSGFRGLFFLKCTKKLKVILQWLSVSVALFWDKKMSN